ncbi:MAG: right-handed parallel beta-helix repeat-containing protein [Candidatus Cloacimonetes bacterium]|nr:right-handed parallel beta-helix repeat-containing protein [Candidatus Cloacimonadota bacterium]
MKTIMIFIMIMGSVLLLATDVSGTQSGTWTADNNPYNVISDITIPEGASLIINPGVEVNVSGNVQILVEGHITAIGTENDSIYFVGESRWKGIKFTSTTETSTLSFCKIENIEDGVRTVNSPVDVYYCHINDALNYCINIFGINGPAETNIKHTKVSGAIKSGINISQNSNVTIEYCDIFNNGLGAQYYGAIHLSNQSANGENNPVIQYNRIHHNLKQGINGWDLTSNSRINPIVRHNIIENNLTGLNLRQVSGLFEYNIIRNNFISGNADSGAGFMIAGASSSPIIRHNEITGNFTAFYIGEGATPILGDLSSDDSETGHNIIQNNIDESNISHSVFIYSGSGNVMAQNNIWDSEDPDEIAATIHDQNDDPSLGLVTFLPVYAQATISGNISHDGDFDFEHVLIFLYDYVTDDMVEFYEVDGLGDYQITVNPGKYWVYAGGIIDEDFDPNENNDPDIKAAGVHVFNMLPKAVIVDAENPAENIDIEMSDLNRYMKIAIIDSFEHQGDTIYTMGLFEHIDEFNVMLLKIENDFVKIVGYKYFDSETDNWANNFSETWTLLKTNNLAVGDMWGMEEDGLIGFYAGSVPTPINLNGQNIYPRRFMYFDNDADEYELFGMTQYYQEEIGIVAYREFSSATQSLKTEYILYDYDISNGGEGLFPIAVGNMWVLEKSEPAMHPTNLIAIERDGSYLLWEPAPGEDWVGYNVYRDNALYAQSNSSFFYELEDEGWGAHNWYVTAFNNNTESEPSNIYDPLGVDTPIFAIGKSRINHYPNPINNQSKSLVSFNIELAEDSDVEINVYNIKGQKVTNITRTKLNKGEHTIKWSVQNKDQKPLSNGIYFYQLKTKSGSITNKMLIIK